MMSAVALRFWLPEQNRGTPSLRKQESLLLSSITLGLARSSAAFRACESSRSRGSTAAGCRGGPPHVEPTRCAQTASAILATSSAFLPPYCAGLGAAGLGDVGLADVG